MKHFLYTIVLIVATTFFACGNSKNDEEYQRNKAELMRIRNISKQHKSLADETCIDSLVAFFEKKGTEEDLFAARFYAAWYLWHTNQDEQAYLAFRELCENASKVRTELVDDMMRSVYTALQVISRKAGDSDTADMWWQQSKTSGVYTRPYLYILFHNKAWNFYQERKLDSCAFYMNLSFDEMTNVEEWDDNKSWCLNEQTSYFAMCGDMYEFKRRNEQLKLHPYKGENGSTNLNIGLLYLKQDKRDSAIYYFKKATSGTDEVALAAYAQLAIDANNRGNKDSIFEYYQCSMERWSSMFQQKGNAYTKRLESVYRNKELSEQLAHKKIITLILILCLVTSLLLVFACGWIVILLRRKRKYDKMKLERAKLTNARLEQNLQRVIEELQNQKRVLSNQEMLKNQKAFDSLTLELKQYAQCKSIAPHQLCEEILRLYAEITPDCILRLKNTYKDIKPNDILICILVSQSFGLSEIAYVTNHDRQEIRQYILRISKGLTGEAIGRMNDFKIMLCERFFDDDEGNGTLRK